MRLLLDQCTPLGLVGLLDRHEAVRAAAMGWAEFSNGGLLEAAEMAGFDALVTSDQNIRCQQKLASRRIGLLVLSTNNGPVLRANTILMTIALTEMSPGGYRELGFPRPLLRRNKPPERAP